MLMPLLIASALSFAAKEPVATATPTPPVGAPAAATFAPGKAPSRYCVMAELTGSRIRRKVCHTADEWIALEGAVPTGRASTR